MTLRDKFKPKVSINTDGEAGRYAKECEKIADEFAIEFAEWYLNLWHTDDDSSFDNKSPQELLEIFKK
jgi:hypothetical protein